VETEFRCDVARFEAHAVIGVHGELDIATAPELEREVVAVAMPPIVGVVLDLGYCTFMDSSGVSAILRLRHHVEEQGSDFRLTSIPRAVETVLRSSGLAEAFGLSARDARRSSAPSRPAP